MRSSAHAALVLLIVESVACSGDPPTGAPSADATAGSDAHPVDAAPPVNPLTGIGSVELVQGGYQFTEGPQWREAEGDLVFSDIPANTIYRYTPGGGAPVVHRMPSGNSNGLAIDGTGAVVAAEHGSRSITRNGTLVVGEYQGNQFNSPNDLVVAADGTIYFTDPPYGLSGRPREISFNGVFRLQTNGTVTAEHQGDENATRPNGIGLSPDGTRVYVADTADGTLWRFPVQGDGSLGTRVEHAMTEGGGDGLAIDGSGNIFVTTVVGIEVFAPDGTRWGVIDVPMQPANCAFGDADHRTLYITARTALYKVRLANAGLPRN